MPERLGHGKHEFIDLKHGHLGNNILGPLGSSGGIHILSNVAWSIIICANHARESTGIPVRIRVHLQPLGHSIGDTAKVVDVSPVMKDIENLQGQWVAVEP